MILNIYFCKTIAKFQLLALLILATIFLLLDLIEQLNDVGTGSFSAFNAFQVTALNAPYLIFDLLPSTILIGSVIAIGSLIQSNELKVARIGLIGNAKFDSKAESLRADVIYYDINTRSMKTKGSRVKFISESQN